jgi:hypothetical protein
MSGEPERFGGEALGRTLPGRRVFGATERLGGRAAIGPRYAMNRPL